MSLRLLTATLIALLALAACSSGGAEEEPSSGRSGPDWTFGQTTDSEESGPEPDAPVIEAPTGTPVDPAQYPDAYAGTAFASPTGNIICYIDEVADQWGCLVKERTYAEPPGAEDCLQSFGNGFSSVQGSALMPLCRGGVITAAESGGGATLPYGHTLTVGTVTCGSDETGVTCFDQDSGHGLFISRAAYAVS